MRGILSGGYAEIVHMTGAVERRMAKLSENDIHQLMLLRISSINGKPATAKDLENMYGKDLLAIRAAMNDMRGGLKTEIECTECGSIYTVPLVNITDFFSLRGRVRRDVSIREESFYLFYGGVFSNLDAILDIPMEERRWFVARIKAQIKYENEQVGK